MNEPTDHPCPAVALGFSPRCQGPDRCARVLWGQPCPRKRQGSEIKTDQAEH